MVSNREEWCGQEKKRALARTRGRVENLKLRYVMAADTECRKLAMAMYTRCRRLWARRMGRKIQFDGKEGCLYICVRILWHSCVLFALYLRVFMVRFSYRYAEAERTGKKKSAVRAGR